MPVFQDGKGRGGEGRGTEGGGGDRKHGACALLSAITKIATIQE